MKVSDKTLTLRKIYEYASERGASELGQFLHFHISKTAISFNILLVLLILYLRNIYIFRSQITICMVHISSMQLPVITYGMALCIQTTVYQQNTDIEKIYEYASERAWKILHFHILKLLFPSIFCWYF